MNKKQVAEIILNSMVNNGPRNDFIKIIESWKNKDKNFYNTIKNAQHLEAFDKYINTGELSFTDQDKFITSQKFWNQPDLKTFLYVARALPQVRQQYPNTYKEIVDDSGNIRLDAGLDVLSKRDKNKDTIWNLIAKAEGNSDSEDDAVSDNELRKVIDQQNKNKQTKVQFTKPQLNMVKKIISQYAKQL